MSAPNKQAREVCWLARDIFQQCLDRHRMEGEKGVPTRCKQLRNEYELACPRQWVKHFDGKYEFKKYQEKIINDGYEPIDEDKKKP